VRECGLARREQQTLLDLAHGDAVTVVVLHVELGEDVLLEVLVEAHAHECVLSVLHGLDGGDLHLREPLLALEGVRDGVHDVLVGNAVLREAADLGDEFLVADLGQVQEVFQADFGETVADPLLEVAQVFTCK